MIDKLHIKNFLAFPELEVPELKLINLVAGKNTAGKTSLLQAIEIIYNNDKLETVKKIHDSRKLEFGGLMHRNNDGSVSSTVTSQVNDIFIGLKSKKEYQVAEIIKAKVQPYIPKPFDLVEAVLIKPTFSYEAVASSWKDVVLTPKENEVLNIVNAALGTNIERISVTHDEIKVLLATDRVPVRIETLGDGVKKMMMIALNLVNSKDSILLIDEIETHLHYSAIRKLWKIIFEYAVKWNIQIVATTHSQDAIREFWYEAAENDDYQKVSQVLRLQVNREGKHEVIQFPFERLDSVMEMKMEIR